MDNGSGSSSLMDIWADSHNWTDSAGFGSRSAIGSSFGFLASIGTGSGSAAGVRRCGEGLGKSTKVSWVTGMRIDHDWMVVVG